MYMLWVDPALVWNANDFGISNTTVPANSIWTPRLYLTNSASSSFAYSANDTIAFVYNTGAVVASFYGKFETSCELDLLYFPFDSQTCDLLFTTTFYSPEQLAFVPYNGSNVNLGKVRTCGVLFLASLWNGLSEFL